MSFGGSEIANLMGTAAHKSQKQFIADKIAKLNNKPAESFKLQEQNIMDWGSFFEPVHRVVLQDIFKCSIYETSMA